MEGDWDGEGRLKGRRWVQQASWLSRDQRDILSHSFSMTHKNHNIRFTGAVSSVHRPDEEPNLGLGPSSSQGLNLS